MNKLLLSAFLAILAIPHIARAEDCFGRASKYQGINHLVLRAIAMKEKTVCK